jgi:protein-disulfide isomerase
MPPRAKGAAGARQASPQTLAIAGGVILLVILAVVLAIVLSNNNSSGGSSDGSGDGPTITIPSGMPAVGSSANAPLPLASEVATMFKGIPQKGLELGYPDAPVTLIEYIDLQCPDCQIFEANQLPELVTKYVRTHKIKIRMQPWSILDGPGEHDSNRGQNATIAAANQNKAFQFSEVLYDNQGTEHSHWMNDAAIANIAASVDGLNLQRLATDANSQATAQIVATVTQWAKTHASEMGGTPTLYLQQGVAIPKWYRTGVPDLGALERAIDALLPSAHK